MNIDHVTTNKDRPVRHLASPASLEEFAKTKLALIVCHYIATHEDWQKMRADNAQRPSCEEVLGDLPSIIASIIDKRVRSLGPELESVFHYLNRQDVGFSQNYHTTFLKCYDSFTCGYDATISCEATGRKLIRSDWLTDNVKFRMACLFCFEDDVRRLRPSEPSEALVAGTGVGASVSSNRVFLFVNFWLDRMECNGLMILYWRRQNIAETLKADAFNSSNFTFVLNELCQTREKRFALIDRLFELPRRINIEYFLPKLNDEQVDYVLQKHHFRIIRDLSLKENYWPLLQQVWTQVKELITEEQFCDLLRMLCVLAFKCNVSTSIYLIQHKIYSEIIRSYSGANCCCHEYDDTRLILCKLWASTSDDWKSAFLNKYLEPLFETLSDFDRQRAEYGMKCHDHDLKFILQLVKEIPQEERKKIWSKYWLVFVVRSRPKYLNRFLNLFLEPDEISGFVESHMMDFKNVVHYMKFLLARGLFDDVMDYMNLCTTNQSVVENFQNYLFNPAFVWNNGRSLDKLLEFGQFIDTVNADVAKCQNIKIAILLYRKYALRNTFGRDMKEMVAVIKEFLNLKLNPAKEMLLKYWQKYLRSKKDNTFEEFFSWLCEAEGKTDLRAFKQFLNIDKLFLSLVTDSVDKLSRRLGHLDLEIEEPVPSTTRQLDDFQEIDDFLKWYFGSEDEAAKYKQRRIMDYKRKMKLKEVIKAKNEFIVNDVLRWAFQGDDIITKIRNFKGAVKSQR